MLYNLYQDSRDPKDPKKLELKQQIESKFATTVVESTKFAANMVLGGDGKMVDGIHELHELKIPFFGVNCGTVGFLLNDINHVDQIPKSLDEMELITEPFLEADITYIPTGSMEEVVAKGVLAVNEILISDRARDMPYITLKTRGSDYITELRASHFIISSAIGSTGYRASNLGEIIPTGIGSIGYMGVMAKPFTYDADPDYPLYEVNIESRVPVEALIDGEQHVYPNVKKVVVRYSDKHFTLGFLKDGTPGSSFQNKRFRLYLDMRRKNNQIKKVSYLPEEGQEHFNK